jgi:DNA polymerase III sliding clamp (beta) subunit (PCNA family)
MKYKIDLLSVNYWDALPNVWKIVKQVSPLNYNFNISDKGLIKLFEPYFSTDAFQSRLIGLNVDKNGLTASNATNLLHIPNKGNMEDGVYLISPKVAKKTKKRIGKLDEKFANYEQIFHDETERVFKIDVYQLKTYCESIIRGKYCNQYTNATTFLVNKAQSKYISFNVESLLEVLNTFLEIGYEYIYGGYIDYNRSMYFGIDVQTVKNPKNSLGKYTIALLMPLITQDNILGARDLDYTTELNVYYSFEDNEIKNANGTRAVFSRGLFKADLPYIKDDELAMLKKIVGKNAKVPIVDNIKVANNTATATDLYQSISIYGVDVEDGIYEIVSGAFKNTTYNILDFPNYIESKQYYYKTYIDSVSLAKSLSEAKNFVADDDLRPNLMGIGYVLDRYGGIRVYSTDAHILYNKTTLSSGADALNKVLKFPKNQQYFVEQMVGNLELLSNDNDEFFMFKQGNIRYITSAESFNPPNYQQVITPNTDMVLDISTSEILKVINGLSKEDLEDTLVFQFEENLKMPFLNGANVKLYTGEKRSGGVQIKKDLKISIPYKLNKVSHDWDSNLALIMPVYSDDETILQFDPKLLKPLLSSSHRGGIYYNSDKLGGQFLVELADASTATKKTPSSTKSAPSNLPIPPQNSYIIPNFNVGDRFKFGTDSIYTIEGIYQQEVTILRPDGSVIDKYSVSEVNKYIKDGTFVKIETKVQSKENIEKAIKGLQYLADKGNDKAIKAIKGLQYLLNK